LLDFLLGHNPPNLAHIGLLSTTYPLEADILLLYKFGADCVSIAILHLLTVQILEDYLVNWP